MSKGPLAASKSAARRANLLGAREPNTLKGEEWFAPGALPQPVPRLQDPAFNRPGPANDN